MEYLEDIILCFGIPVSICVVLPVLIVWLVARVRINKDNKRTEIIIKALESNGDVNTDKLVETLNQSQLSGRELQNRRLLRGCIFSLLGVVCVIAGVAGVASIPAAEVTLLGGGLLAVGISYMVVYFVSRKNEPEEDENAE